MTAAQHSVIASPLVDWSVAAQKRGRGNRGMWDNLLRFGAVAAVAVLGIYLVNGKGAVPRCLCTAFKVDGEVQHHAVCVLLLRSS